MRLRRGIEEQKQRAAPPPAQPLLIGCQRFGRSAGLRAHWLLGREERGYGRGLTGPGSHPRCLPGLVVAEARYPPPGPGRWCWVVAR